LNHFSVSITPFDINFIINWFDINIIAEHLNNRSWVDIDILLNNNFTISIVDNNLSVDNCTIIINNLVLKNLNVILSLNDFVFDKVVHFKVERFLCKCNKINFTTNNKLDYKLKLGLYDNYRSIQAKIYGINKGIVVIVHIFYLFH
jgi:hypothetical protein